MERGRSSSFRDPAGCVFLIRDRVFRLVTAEGTADLKAFLGSPLAHSLFASGRLIRTSHLSRDESVRLQADAELDIAPDGGVATIMEHERVPFPSYPYEWPPEMLHEAGALTLDLAEILLREGLGLKDATPYNVLFRGPDPVFIDLLSIERRDPENPIWLPYAQFTRTFLLPLLVNRFFGIPVQQVLMTRRDGLEPEEVFRLCGPLRRLRPRFLSLVSLPTWLRGWGCAVGLRQPARGRRSNSERARFVLRHLLQHLRRNLDWLAPRAARRSRWSGYIRTSSYTPRELAVKEAVVRAVLDSHAPRTVLDLGCNTGHFSVIAAAASASVVAVDSDPVVVGETWRRARAQHLDILPLVVDLSRPSPAIGWRGLECAAFLDRARGHFDAVLMLAVLHHLLVTERIPLLEILRLAAELTRDVAVIEFVSPHDPMFRSIARGRELLFAGLDHASFQEACKRHFRIEQVHDLEGGTRSIFVLRKRPSPS